MDSEIKNLKEFIHEKFPNHEQLEKLRFQIIDELISHFGKEIEDNEGTIRRIHSRVDKIEASIKTVKSVGVAGSGAIATFNAWLGISSK